MRLRNLNRGPISDAKHEHLEQPDRGYSINNSKMTVKTNKQQQNSRSVFKKGGESKNIFHCLRSMHHWFKIAFISLFFPRKILIISNIYLTCCISLHYKRLITTKCSKTKLASPHIISVCRLLFQFCSTIFTIKWGWANCTVSKTQN